MTETQTRDAKALDYDPAVAELESRDTDELKVETFHEVCDVQGQRHYISRSEKEAKDRLQQLAAKSNGVGLDPTGEPHYVLRTVQAVEVRTKDKDAPETRTRGK